MAGDAVNRRDFLKRAGAITAAGTAVFSFEEQILQAHQAPPQQAPPPEGAPPFGRRNQPPAPDVAGPIPTSPPAPPSARSPSSANNRSDSRAEASSTLVIPNPAVYSCPSLMMPIATPGIACLRQQGTVSAQCFAEGQVTRRRAIEQHDGQ